MQTLNLADDASAAETVRATQQFLTFSIGTETFGLDIRHVVEIIGLQRITRVPDVPHHLRGVINLRGKVIPIMDVRLRFGMEERDYDARTCIVVIHVDDADVGLVVDRVQEVLDVPQKAIGDSPAFAAEAGGNFVEAMAKVGDKVIILLGVEKMVFA